MIGPWKGPDRRVHDATEKPFELEFCTIVEENLLYDPVGFLVRSVPCKDPPADHRNKRGSRLSPDVAVCPRFGAAFRRA